MVTHIRIVRHEFIIYVLLLLVKVKSGLVFGKYLQNEFGKRCHIRWLKDL